MWSSCIPEELNHEDEEHKEPRRDPNAMPDPYSLSNTLRAVGAFLDRKPDIKLLFAPITVKR